ncbi:MAG: hypothetical protein HYU67_12785 [Flavobacteriia bacterium]|nr:hypothetical protein [Flavobacteriia bacterium]
MSTSALILIIIVWTLVTLITGYFFYKILTIKPNPEPDSYLDNDQEEHLKN